MKTRKGCLLCAASLQHNNHSNLDMVKKSMKSKPQPPAPPTLDEIGDALCKAGEGCKKHPQHTPTPWHRNISPAWKYPIYADRTGNDTNKNWIHIAAVLPGNPNNEADLDFIVRAVNAHDPMKHALEVVLKTMYANPNENMDMITKCSTTVKQAIARAEGK